MLRPIVLLISISALCRSQEIAGCKVFPANHIWNTRVDHLPLHPLSSLWIDTVGTDRSLRADFGSGLFNGAAIGIPLVTVTGDHRGQVTPVQGILVRYRIDSLRPAGPSGRATLTNASGTPQRPDSTIAVDTTDASGTASRSVLVVAGSGVARVFISASARRLTDGAPLAGSPVRFELAVKP